MRIEKTALDAQNRCVYSLYKEKGCIGHAVTCADCFEALEIAPEWQSLYSLCPVASFGTMNR